MREEVIEDDTGVISSVIVPTLEPVVCQGHSSLDAPSELNLPQKIPSPLLLHY